MDHNQILQALEESLLTSAVRRNRAKMSALLAEGFREFGASGRVFSKAEVIDMLQAETPASLSLDSFEAQQISPQAILVTYRETKEAAGSAPTISLRSSLWIFRGEHWQMLFHQGTKIAQK